MGQFGWLNGYQGFVLANRKVDRTDLGMLEEPPSSNIPQETISHLIRMLISNSDNKSIASNFVASYILSIGRKIFKFKIVNL